MYRKALVMQRNAWVQFREVVPGYGCEQFCVGNARRRNGKVRQNNAVAMQSSALRRHGKAKPRKATVWHRTDASCNGVVMQCRVRVLNSTERGKDAKCDFSAEP